jgi:hypothetical protein
MSTVISLVLQVLSVGLVLYYAKLTDATSLLIAAIALVAICTWRVLARQHSLARLDSAEEQAEQLAIDHDEEPLHPFSVFLTALAKSAIILGLMIPFFVVADLATPYQLPFDWVWQSPITDPSGDSANDSVTPADSATLSLKLVGHKYVEPHTHFVDGIFSEDLGIPFSSPEESREHLELLVDGESHDIMSVNEIFFEYPLRVSVVRDVTPSIMSSQPFPDLGKEATKSVVTSLQQDMRKSEVRIVDFAATTTVVCDWTNEYEHLGDLSLRPARVTSPAASAVNNSIVGENTELSRRPDSTRVLVVISDFANNVQSGYNAFGVAAEAKRHGVTLILVYLKTQDFAASRINQLELLAAETGGVCLNGADPKLNAQIQEALATTHKPFPAYRVMFESNKDIGINQLQLQAVLSSTTVKPVVAKGLGG